MCLLPVYRLTIILLQKAIPLYCTMPALQAVPIVRPFPYSATSKNIYLNIRLYCYGFAAVFSSAKTASSGSFFHIAVKCIQSFSGCANASGNFLFYLKRFMARVSSSVCSFTNHCIKCQVAQSCSSKLCFTTW